MRLPTFFLSHGGGPWPWLKTEMPHFAQLEASLVAIPKEVAPTAILMISGHWESDRFLSMSAERPPMLYDYSGFPAHTYSVRYPALGHPPLARRAVSLLNQAGLPSDLDPNRGFDHGAFTPLAVMYPAAEIPVVQLSLVRGYDPDLHLRAGRALAPLRDEGVLILGSGLSYHNLRLFGGSAANRASAEFDAWLSSTLKADPEERASRLHDWTRAPSARLAHPREDHLAPLFVALGAAFDGRTERIYHETSFMGGLTVSSYRFD